MGRRAAVKRVVDGGTRRAADGHLGSLLKRSGASDRRGGDSYGSFSSATSVTTCVATGVTARVATVRCLVFVTRATHNRGGAVGFDGGGAAILGHDDDDGAVASVGVEGDGGRPLTGEIDILVAAERGDADGGGVLGSVSCDGGLHVSDAHVVTGHETLGQCVEGAVEGLGVERVVAVGGSAVALWGDGLTDGAQMELEVHLDEGEDGLALAGRRGAVGADRHGWGGTDVGFSVAGYVGDTVDGTAGFTARTDLFYLSHSCLKIFDC